MWHRREELHQRLGVGGCRVSNQRDLQPGRVGSQRHDLRNRWVLEDLTAVLLVFGRETMYPVRTDHQHVDILVYSRLVSHAGEPNADSGRFRAEP